MVYTITLHNDKGGIFLNKLKEKMKNLKVERKLSDATKVTLIGLLIVLVFAVIGIGFTEFCIRDFYLNPYENTKLQLEVRKDIQLIGKNLLWATTTEDSAVAAEKIALVEEYGEKVAENVIKLEHKFNNKELIAELDADLEDLKEQRIKVVELINQGAYDEAIELFNGDYNTATENLQNVLLEIGDEADKDAINSYNFANGIGLVIIIVMLFVGITSFAIGRRFAKVITGIILEPVYELKEAAIKLKAGDLDVNINYESQDEFGELSENFRGACKQMKDIVQDAGKLLSKMADSDFDVHTTMEESYVGNFGLLIESINKLSCQLSETLRHINDSSEQVNIGAAQLSDSAQALAEGATDQAGAIQELTATIETVTNISADSAVAAKGASEDAMQSVEQSLKSSEDMNELVEAMKRITETSHEIENIIGAIEDIAAQTNLLSLNASIEAARAGEAGRGFAVVADQIGSLASDSARSAVTTRELIVKSLDEIKLGNEIAERTMEAIQGVLDSINNIAQAAQGAAEASRTQSDMLNQVESGIEQISIVVQNNSASAEETSAISEELSAQVVSLKEMVSGFNLRRN